MTHEALNQAIDRLNALEQERLQVTRAAFDSLKQLDPELWRLAVQTLEDEARAADWFSKPSSVFDERMPLVVFRDGDREAVVRALYQLEHGIIS